MRGAVLFVAGVLVGGLLTQSGAAQDVRPRGLNHVGIAVKNVNETVAFYKKTLGFKEAYALQRPDGSPLLTYLQISRDTFLEVLPAGAGQPAGITHFAIEFGDLQAAADHLRQQGVTAANPGLTPGKALFTRMTDPDGVSIEVMEFGPESQQRKAMDAWK
jgi:catechol 2,3-dioxygenase-like lactoylglutathione lyase family enzyme